MNCSCNCKIILLLRQLMSKVVINLFESDKKGHINSHIYQVLHPYLIKPCTHV